jgi:hypothetical protein
VNYKDKANTPNPGSPEAVAAGCICPVLDNNHGSFAPFADEGWWLNGRCPVHVLLPPGDEGAAEWQAYDEGNKQ